MVTTEKFKLKETVALALSSRWVEGGKIACRSFSSDLIQSLARIERFRLLLQSSFKVRLPTVRRADWSLKSLREFSEGILDSDCVCHDWRTSLLRQHASRQVRVTVASSLFLFRKVIPKPLTAEEVSQSVLNYIDKMTSASPPLDVKFRSFCVRKMEHLFKVDWDKRWKSKVKAFTLPTSACVERSRKRGGARGGDRTSLREQFLAFTEGREELELGQVTEPMMIWTGGKWRLVTKFSERRSFLSPLHRLIYDHLSKRNWLLRGEATRDEFEAFVKVDGEIFVSGDYESATDNLNIELSDLILDCLQKSSTHVPSSVWSQARKGLHNIFPDGRIQRTGQLMGSLLSFPLLCIANYLTFKWAVPRQVPLKINGDDIVFRCTKEEKDKWFSVVGASGLRVSKGKTMTLKSAFSLNSTFFLSAYSHVKACPVVRSTCLFGGVEDPNQIGGRLKGVYAGGGFAGDCTRAFALREMSKQVWSSQRSVRGGLGATVSWRALNWAGLQERETFYNEMAVRRVWRKEGKNIKPSGTIHHKAIIEPILPIRKKEWIQNAIPEGYVRERASSEDQEDHPDFVKEMIECCWNRDPIVGEKERCSSYWEAVKEGTFRYVPPIDKKFARMAGMTENEIKRYYGRRTNKETDKRKVVWVKVPNDKDRTSREGTE